MLTPRRYRRAGIRSRRRDRIRRAAFPRIRRASDRYDVKNVDQDEDDRQASRNKTANLDDAAHVSDDVSVLLGRARRQDTLTSRLDRAVGLDRLDPLTRPRDAGRLGLVLSDHLRLEIGGLGLFLLREPLICSGWTRLRSGGGAPVGLSLAGTV